MLGVVEEGALANLLLVDGNLLENIKLVAEPDKNFLVIMKNGTIYKKHRVGVAKVGVGENEPCVLGRILSAWCGICWRVGSAQCRCCSRAPAR